MLLRVFPLLSALMLWLASSSQAALFVAAPPASTAPSTPENASTAFFEGGSESRIGLLVGNDPLDKTDPMGLDPVIVDAEADVLAHQADLRNLGAYKTSSSHWWQTGYEYATTVYQDKTGRRSLSETRTDRNSGRVVPPKDAQKASLVETHNHTNDNNDATTHSRIGKFDANRGDITGRTQEVISPDGTQQRYRPSDKPTLEGRREEGGAIEQKQNGKWVPLKDANTNLKDPFDHRNATGN